MRPRISGRTPTSSVAGKPRLERWRHDGLLCNERTKARRHFMVALVPYLRSFVT
jgi:hypothetical protein